MSLCADKLEQAYSAPLLMHGIQFDLAQTESRTEYSGNAKVDIIA